MKLRNVALALGATAVGMFAYGMLVESNRLVVERRRLRLKKWPKHLDGFRIVVLADFHVRGKWSIEQAHRAVAAAIAEQPDMVVLPGDFIDFWKPASDAHLREFLGPLRALAPNLVAVPGNHDYFYAKEAENLRPALSDVGIRLLRNEVWEHKGITWVGMDSEVMGKADPVGTMAKVEHFPAISIWHEADNVHRLPEGCALQISGHSHGGQFRFPFGFTPMHSVLGKKYEEGFFPHAPTPLYVSRGIGTTGPPSRFLCPPEVSVLTLLSDGSSDMGDPAKSTHRA